VLHKKSVRRQTASYITLRAARGLSSDRKVTPAESLCTGQGVAGGFFGLDENPLYRIP
jgi:hypothetical protein